MTTLPPQQNELEQFNALYELLELRITNYVCSLSRGCAMLEPADLIQDTWLKVWRSRAEHVGAVFIIARNTVIDAMRHQQRYLRVLDPLPLDMPMEDGNCYTDILEDGGRDFTELVESHDLREPIRVILAGLCETQRVAIILGAEGYTDREIALERHLNQKTVKGARYRGTLVFRQQWEREEVG